MQIEKLKAFIQSANINFLLGSGLSCPYLSTLGNIERWLTDLQARSDIDSKIINIIEASIYKTYFERVIYPNSDKFKLKKANKKNFEIVLDNYKTFLTTWNEILNKRANKLLSKQLNIYTTNIDTFIEKVADGISIEFNDGFQGSIEQIFNEGNFQKSLRKTSVHYQNTFEVPVFNLLKMHGSINWKKTDGIIYNDIGLEQINEIQKKLKKIPFEYFVFIEEKQNIDNFIESASKICSDKPAVDFDNIYNVFLDAYHKLIMVNPTKRKFSETVMDIHFYELMRMFSNALEKESSVLFVMGFSFADEHIREIALRAAKTNPTLEIIIFSHGKDYEQKEMLSKATNNNIHILTVENFKGNNKNDDSIKGEIGEWKNFDFATVNRVFSIINAKIPAINGQR